MMTNPITSSGTTTATAASIAGSSASAGAAATAGIAAGQDSAVDTVTLQGKPQDTKDVAPAKVDSGNSTIGRISAVLFSYNSKGALRIKFMDSKNTLVYQTPPVMMARMMDLMMRPDYSVNARV